MSSDSQEEPECLVDIDDSLVPFCGNSSDCVPDCIHKRCESDCLIFHVAVSELNPDECRPADPLGHVAHDHSGSRDHIQGEDPAVHHGHQEDLLHRHGTTCGHEIVQHGDHLDFLVDSHLHHRHGNHCDDHGFVDLDSFLQFDLCECPQNQEVYDADPSARLPNSDRQNSSQIAFYASDESDASHQLNMVGPSCSTCKRKVLPAAHRTRLAEESVNSKAEVPVDHVATLVKARNQAAFSTASPLHHLKGVTPEFAKKLKEAASEALKVECSTVGQLAELTEEHIAAIKSRDSGGYRTLAGLHDNARLLVNNVNDEVNTRKRAQNAACCHRFRQRKKQKVETLETTLQEISIRHSTLLQRITDLEQERDRLRELAYGPSGAPPSSDPPGPNTSTSPQTTSSPPPCTKFS